MFSLEHKRALDQLVHHLSSIAPCRFNVLASLRHRANKVLRRKVRSGSNENFFQSAKASSSVSEERKSGYAWSIRVLLDQALANTLANPCTPRLHTPVNLLRSSSTSGDRREPSPNISIRPSCHVLLRNVFETVGF